MTSVFGKSIKVIILNSEREFFEWKNHFYADGCTWCEMFKNGNDEKTFSLTGPDFFSCAAGAAAGAATGASDIFFSHAKISSHT